MTEDEELGVALEALFKSFEETFGEKPSVFSMHHFLSGRKMELIEKWKKDYLSSFSAKEIGDLSAFTYKVYRADLEGKYECSREEYEASKVENGKRAEVSKRVKRRGKARSSE